MNCDKYKATLDDTPVTNAKRLHTATLASAVAKQVSYLKCKTLEMFTLIKYLIPYYVLLQEKDLTNHYAETAAESDQLLNQMNFAKSIMSEVQMREQQFSCLPLIKRLNLYYTAIHFIFVMKIIM